MNDEWAINGLMKLYSFQTDEETMTGSVAEYNGKGFNKTDSEILSAIASEYDQTGHIEPMDMATLHTKMPKYANQLFPFINRQYLIEQFYELR